jgi:hypothetical protein
VGAEEIWQTNVKRVVGPESSQAIFRPGGVVGRNGYVLHAFRTARVDPVLCTCQLNTLASTVSATVVALTTNVWLQVVQVEAIDDYASALRQPKLSQQNARHQGVVLQTMRCGWLRSMLRTAGETGQKL